MSDQKPTKDLLSRQERGELEMFEQWEQVPFDAERNPIKAIHNRLLGRDLLVKNEPNKNCFGHSLSISDRGLTALRGGVWHG